MNISGVVGFLGFGNMGQAIAKGLVSSGTVSAERLAAYDVNREASAEMDSLGGAHADSAEALAAQSNTIVLASKPQDMQSALESIADHLRSETLLISIAAGISIAFIQGVLGPNARVARVMPNTPALVGAGAAAVALSETCSEADEATVMAMFESIGVAERVTESAMDAVTALSGSGPAYFFAFVESMTEAGVALGLSETQSSRLAGQTMYGAGKLLVESGESATTLRARVTSKGGTTEAALKTFEEGGLSSLVRSAMESAAARSKALGQ